MIACGRCGKKCETIGMTYNEHFRIFARFRKDKTNYAKCIDLCDSCHDELRKWLLSGGYEKQDIPALPMINPSEEIFKLRRTVKELEEKICERSYEG